MIWLRRSLRWLIYIPLSALLLTAVLVSTEFGSRLAVGLASTLIPGIDIDYRSGRLNDEISLHKFELDLDFLTITAIDADISWNPWCSVRQELCINTVRVTDFDLRLDTDEDEPASPSASAESVDDDTPYQLDLPFAMHIKQAQVANGIVQVDDIIIQWQGATASAHLYDDTIDIQQANFTSGSVHVDANTTSSSEQPASNSASNEQAWPLAHLSDTRLPLKLFVEQASADRFAFAYQDWLQESFSNITIDGDWQYVSVNIKQVAFHHEPYGKLDVAGVAELNHPYPMQLDIKLSPSELPSFAGLNGSQWQATIDGDLNNLVLAASEQQQLFWQIHGDAALADENLPFNLTLAGQQMIWPDDLEQLVQYQAINGHASGTLAQQDFELTGKFTGTVADEPMKSNVVLAGHHANQTLTITTLELTEINEGGKLTANGQLQYNIDPHATSSASTNGDELQWQLNASFDQLQLPKFDQADSAIISGQLQHQGSFTSVTGNADRPQQWQLAFDDTQISGEYMGLPMTIHGDLAVNDLLQGHADNLHVEVAGSTLQLNGRVDNNWQLNGQLQGRQLKQWLPGLSGDLDGTFSVSGPYQDPLISVSAAMERGGYDSALQFELAQLDATYQPLSDHQHQLQLTFIDTELGHLPSEKLTASSSGTLSQHQFDIAGLGEFAPIVKLSGQWQAPQQRWQGELAAAQFDTSAGHWQLNKAVQLAFLQDQQQLTVSAHCWRASDSELCLQQDATLGKTGNADISLKISGRDLTRELLHEDYQVRGSLIGELDAHWRDGQPANASLQLNSSDIEMSFHNPLEEQTQTVAINSVNIVGQITEQQTSFELGMVAQHGSEVDFNGSLEHESGALQANIAVNNVELGHFKSLLPDIERVQGLLKGQAKVTGTLEQPDIHGQFNLSDGVILLLSNPTPIDALQAELVFDGNSALINTSLNLGENTATLTAAADWADEFELQSNFRGDKLKILLPPESDFLVSPDLQFNIANGQQSLSGRIGVPAANIIFRSLPDSGIDLSDDEVFIDQTSQQSTSATNLSAKVDIELGDEIKVEAVGFTGRIGGHLEVRKRVNAPLQLYGPIQLQSGRYRAYGQRLEIQNDSVIHFNGPPRLANLNIRAAREIKSADVIAGIHATGTVEQPTIEFFSDPTMEQQEILSYIVRGRGLDSDDNSSMAAAAAFGVSAAESMGLTNSMEQLTGIQQVALDTEGEGDETQVTISGYVGERFYLKYGMGVFEPINEVTVRFYLLNQLWLETVSGIENSADLYYSFFIE
ncbi:translocation/assembly module TamB domain-containing protein [Neiella marina]|uniref:Translocation/assembly module TamB domain-containing protein n=1 Tax=Neiella holothuriorum TaxID=2870530 RepID=A0ABS7EF62_9GAMM|nr:translocation/assembly module TamB domain-containing protein [Neiella holothuriorum]MBW8191001.1 translocation/assembly module TamB domain-containing protein [Neiella holothuriorum]